MTLSALTDKSREPTDKDLRKVLGKAYEPWAQLVAAVGERINPISQLWAFSSQTTSWGLRLRHKERVILYMKPQPGQFLVSFALGEKAVAAAHRLELPAALLKAIDAAPRYAEGRGVRFEVSKSAQVLPLAALAQIKQQN